MTRRAAEGKFGLYLLPSFVVLCFQTANEMSEFVAEDFDEVRVVQVGAYEDFRRRLTEVADTVV